MARTIFGSNLKNLRQAAHISRVKLAQAIHISERSIGAYERGENEPGFETLNMIADYFGTSTDVLLGRTSQNSLPPELGYSSQDDNKSSFLNGVWELHEKYFGE